MANCHIRAFSGIMTWPFAVLAQIVLAGIDWTTIVTPQKIIGITKPESQKPNVCKLVMM